MKLTEETSASRLMVLTAALLSLLAMTLALIYESRQSGHVAGVLAGFVVVAAVSEILLQRITGRNILPRILKDKFSRHQITDNGPNKPKKMR